MHNRNQTFSSQYSTNVAILVAALTVSWVTPLRAADSMPAIATGMSARTARPTAAAASR